MQLVIFAYVCYFCHCYVYSAVVLNSHGLFGSEAEIACLLQWHYDLLFSGDWCVCCVQLTRLGLSKIDVCECAYNV